MKFTAPLRSMQKMCSSCASLVATLILLSLPAEQVQADVNVKIDFSTLTKKILDIPIQGTVLDETGLPIPGASVKFTISLMRL